MSHAGHYLPGHTQLSIQDRGPCCSPVQIVGQNHEADILHGALPNLAHGYRHALPTVTVQSGLRAGRPLHQPRRQGRGSPLLR